jgi:nitrogen regulatory protein PII
MELYYVISITDRERSNEMLAICEELNMSFVITNLGKGTATGEHLSIHDLQAREKEVISTVADADGMKKLMRLAKKKMYVDIPGNGIVAAIPIKSVGSSRALSYFTDGKQPKGGKPDMNFENELIVVILNEGYSDMVMDAARSAGAAGGTVFHAKGTGKTKVEKFLGVSLAEEKDIIYIVASEKKKSEIMNAINKNAGVTTEARAISFSLPVTEVAGLRHFDEE